MCSLQKTHCFLSFHCQIFHSKIHQSCGSFTEDGGTYYNNRTLREEYVKHGQTRGKGESKIKNMKR